MTMFGKAWRILRTGISFVLFSWGGLFMALVYFPAFNLITPDDAARHARARRAIHRAFRIYCGVIDWLGIAESRVQHAERLHNLRGTLIVANHPSLLDVVMLIARLPDAQCVVKAELYDNFFLRGVVKAAGFIRNDGDMTRLIEDCSASLAAGDNLVIFPEGTRSVPGAPLKLQRGAANIAFQTKGNILPVTILCNTTSLAKGGTWYRVADKKIEFDLVVGEPVSVDQILVEEGAPSADRPKAARRLTKWMTEYFTHGIYNEYTG